MKIKKIVRKLYEACINHNKEKEKKLWFKGIKKSLQKKHTEVIR